MGCKVRYLPKHSATELIVTMACVHALRRFTPAIAPVVLASQNARNTIVALGVTWPLLRECVTCLQLHRLVKNLCHLIVVRFIIALANALSPLSL